MDDIDARILGFLEKDMETSYQLTVDQLGASVATVYDRVRRLKQTGFIKKIDYERLGYAITALVGVSVSAGASKR